MQRFELVHLNTGFSLAAACKTGELAFASAQIRYFLNELSDWRRPRQIPAWPGSLTFLSRSQYKSNYRTFTSTLPPHKLSFAADLQGPLTTIEDASRSDFETDQKLLDVKPGRPNLKPSRAQKCRHGPDRPSLFRRSPRYNKHRNVYGHDQAICRTAFGLE